MKGVGNCFEFALHVAAVYHNLSTCCQLAIMHDRQWSGFEDTLLTWQYYLMCDHTASKAIHELHVVHQELVAVTTQLCASCRNEVIGTPRHIPDRNDVHLHRKAKGTNAALCLSGLAFHGMVGSSAIVQSAQYTRLFRWVNELKLKKVNIDVFMYLDLRQYRAKTVDTQSKPVENVSQRPSSTTELTDAVRVLRPVKFLLHEEKPVCMQQAAFCQCTKAWPRWLEQMLKRQRCMELIHNRERETGYRYDWVMQMRSDYNTEAAGHASRAPDILAAMTAGAQHPQVVHTKPFFSPPGYGQMEFFWLSQRRAADTMSSVLNASCAWLQCVTALAPRDMQNERLLVEWAHRGGLRFMKLLPAERTPGTLAHVFSGGHEMRKCDKSV